MPLKYRIIIGFCAVIFAAMAIGVMFTGTHHDYTRDSEVHFGTVCEGGVKYFTTRETGADRQFITSPIIDSKTLLPTRC